MLSNSASGLRIGYFAHSLRSDWNNGNAHFLRGLMRSLVKLGHQVTVFEAETAWSIDNLRTEPLGAESQQTFDTTYPELRIDTYPANRIDHKSKHLEAKLADMDVVLLHEWNPVELSQALLLLRDRLGFRLLFHDTHHRASSSPAQIEGFGLDRFDGILAFGESLRTLYRERFGLERIWTLHEAADISVFHPLPPTEKTDDLVWIGNWGDGERSREIGDFLLKPASALKLRATIYGVRYPPEGLAALEANGVRYGGYIPNLDAPRTYSTARLTVHIPRQQYSSAMEGIPTIRVFEALACGIPLISAPWVDSEKLFDQEDFMMVSSYAKMVEAIRLLLDDPAAAEAQAAKGYATVITRHTCDHRALELTNICREVLR